MKFATLLAAVSLAISGIDAQLSKPVITPSFPSLDSPLMAALAPTLSTHDQWEWGWIPNICKFEANLLGLSPYDFEVFNIHYTDCPSDVWIFCRHHDSPHSQIDLIDIFGRLPVRTRSFVRHVVAVPGDRGAHNRGDNILIKGGGTNLMTLMTHEVGHSLDAHAVPSLPAPFHTTAEWLAAYNADSAVSDGYAQTHQQENFAQEVVIAMFDRNVPGGIGIVQPNWSAIYNQYTAVRNWLGDVIVPGGTCTGRLANDVIVSMGPATGHGARLRVRTEKPDVSLSSNVTVIPPAPEGTFDGSIPE